MTLTNFDIFLVFIIAFVVMMLETLIKELRDVWHDNREMGKSERRAYRAIMTFAYTIMICSFFYVPYAIKFFYGVIYD